MDDYLNLLKEYQEINAIYKSLKDDYDIFESYINQFLAAISLLNKPKLKDENIKDNNLIFFVEKFCISVEKLKNYNIVKNNEIIDSLKQVYINQNNQMVKVIDTYNKIKNELFEEKLNLNNAKKEYIKLLNENRKKSKSKKVGNESDDLFYESKKESSYISYKYELEKFNEKIDNSNENYKKMKKELDMILLTKENTIKIFLLKFSKMVGNIGQIFIEFKNNLEEKLNKVMNENVKIINIKIEDRFQKEKLEKKEDLELKYKEKNKDGENNINNNNEESQQKQNFQNNKIENNQSIGGFDFEILDDFNDSKEPLLIDLINKSIEDFLDTKLISSFNVSSLIENIKSSEDCSLKFINEIKKHEINDSIILKNKQNFIHLSNIFNELIISKSKNFKIIAQTLEISQKIKYNDLLISSVLKNKNKIISSQNFWISFINYNIKYNLTKYIKDVIDNKKMKIDKNNSNQKISEKILNLLNSITSFKNLNKKQKILVEKNSYEYILYTIAKSVKFMTNFSLPQNIIIEIFNYYHKIFDFGIEIYYYFQNILNIKFQRNILKINSLQEQTKEKYGLFLSKEQLIILNVAKFLPKIEYIKFFTLNKLTYSKVRKYLIRYRLTYLDITIDERIELWEILLNVKEIRKKYNYNVIKNNYLNNSCQINYYGRQKEKYLQVIDLDLLRTSLFNSQETHKIKANFILKCSAVIEPEINYYQGMNFILLFLYQVLNYDEERTFYIFWALLKETKFLSVYENEMKYLSIYFKVLEKIFEYNYPDIYQSLSKNKIEIQLFATPWFVTLFGNDNVEFERKKVPKFLFLAFESFLLYGWAGIINLGLSLCLYNREKIMNYNRDNLLKFIIQKLGSIKNINEEDFPKIKQIFINNTEKIDETYINKIINVINFEKGHPILTNNEI